MSCSHSHTSVVFHSPRGSVLKPGAPGGGDEGVASVLEVGGKGEATDEGRATGEVRPTDEGGAAVAGDATCEGGASSDSGIEGGRCSYATRTSVVRILRSVICFLITSKIKYTNLEQKVFQ